MGIWFLATSVGNYIGGRVSGLYESFAAADAFRRGRRLCVRLGSRHVRAHAARFKKNDGPGELRD